MTNCKVCEDWHVCANATTIETLVLERGYWRHSDATPQTWLCKSNGDWSPCAGGDRAGVDGNGYCASGYRGPRCELCVGTSNEDGGSSLEVLRNKYFDGSSARCRDCGDATVLAAIVFGTTFFIVFVSAGGGALILWHRPAVSKFIRSVLKLFRKAGMQFKVKAIVGLYQCVTAVSSVFDVTTPSGLDEFTGFINLLEFEFDVDIIIPGSCLGNYQRRLVITACWPIGLLLVASASCVAWELWQDRRYEDASKVAPRGRRMAVKAGLHRVLPATLLLTFLLVPSTATRIFKTFLCDRFEYDRANGLMMRYLHDDLAVSCESHEYDRTFNTAIMLICVWPVGVPLLYALLLWASRDALLTGTKTPLSRATSFLSGDYRSSVFWWEPLEMCRKLTLSTHADSRTGGLLHFSCSRLNGVGILWWQRGGCC